MKRILWLSRHKPTPRQHLALREEFGLDHLLIIDERAFDSAEDIATRYRIAQADELIVVAPDPIIHALIAHNFAPIKVKMRPVPCRSPKAEVRVTRSRHGHRTSTCYEFVGFARTHRLSLGCSATPFTTNS